jgi:UTP:GlnB (protein PII) uridylyltransferase
MRTDETQVHGEIRQAGPLAAFQRLIAENNALIRSVELGNGRVIASARTAIYTGLVGEWGAEQRQVFDYDKPFAVVALGGTGRAEMSPCSDNDFAFLFDDALEGNPFLLELQSQVLHSDEFEK